MPRANVSIVKDDQKISDTSGGFTSSLDDGDRFGFGVAEIGDLDGDGVVDYAVSALYDDDGGAGNGAVYILFMNTDGTVRDEQKISETEGSFSGTLDGDGNFGIAIRAVGDLDGDMNTEIAVGERARDDGGTNRGGYWILFLDSDGTVKDEQLVSDISGGLGSALDDRDLFGNYIEPIGDVDGDTVTDIAVSSIQDDDGGLNQGAIYVIRQNTDGTVKSYTKLYPGGGFSAAEVDDDDKWGTSVAVIDDLDGDGVDDWVTSAPRDDDGAADTGAVYVLFMNSNATIKSYQKISATEGNFSADLEADDRFGSVVDGIGDINGDGTEDILVGSWRDDDGGTDRGAIYLLLLNTDGTVKDWLKVSETEGGFSGGLDDSDWLGFQLSAVDDLDGNGVNDVLVGSLNDDDGGLDRGAVYTVFLSRLFEPVSKTFITPRETRVSINDGAECTTDSMVRLTLEAKDAKDVVIGSDPYFIGSNWRPFDTSGSMTIEWQLPQEDGEHPIYALFRSRDRNQSNLISESIKLDRVGQCGKANSEVTCRQQCDLLRFQIFLKNPDGSEVRSDGNMVRVNWLDDEREVYYFEDSVDGDFNDVIIYADREKCEDWNLEVLAVNAMNHHEVGIRAFYNGELVTESLLGMNSHDMIGVRKRINGRAFLPVCKEL